MKVKVYLRLSGLGTQPPAKQVQALTLCFSCETVTVVDNLGLSDDQRGSVGEIVVAIQRYVDGVINRTVERKAFRQRVQLPGEAFDDFLSAYESWQKRANSAQMKKHTGPDHRWTPKQ